MFGSVRVRLTLWYTAVLALVLMAFSGISYALLARGIRSATDAALSDTVREAAAAFSNDPARALAGRDVHLDFRHRDRALMVFAPGRGLVAETASRFTRAERQRIADAARRGLEGYATVEGGEENDGIRLFAATVGAGGMSYRVVVAQDLDPQADRLEDAARAVALGIPLALLIAAGGGYLLARKSLAPVARAFELQRSFMADASHELRTPVAIIQGEADVALSRPRSSADYRESIEIMQKAARKLTRIVHDLFLLARSDAGNYPMSFSRFYLDELLEGCVRSMKTAADAKRIDLACQAPRDAVMLADEELLQRLVLNLLDNAIRFTPAEGRVAVQAERTAEGCTIEVMDSGPGIRPEDQPLVFERFFRAERARTEGGAGLGLAIARWAAAAHGGTLDIARSDTSGTVFVVRLPAPSLRSG